MEKKCFILQALTEPDGYSKGHFNRVYQYIMAPACLRAGLSATRISDLNLDVNPFALISALMESDLVLCDISANHLPSLYGFAFRQAAALPFTLMKDIKTKTIATIPEFEIIEYDDSLRIDTVENEVEILSTALNKTFDLKTEPHPIISSLNISPTTPRQAPIAENTSASLQEATPEPKSTLPVISPLPDYVGEPLSQSDIDHLKVGDVIFHMNYGKGEILTVNHKTKDFIVKVQFDTRSMVLVLTPSDIFRKVKQQ
jgi:hypothetical protein